MKLYLIPGMATDCRVFSGFNLQNYDVQCIEWVDYRSSSSLAEYAALLMDQVDTTETFALAGVSMGGMLAQEMARLHTPEFIALVSSAERLEELPKHYQMGRILPLHHLNNSFFLSIYLATPFAMRGVKAHANRKLYLEMIKDTGARFMNWQIDKIIRWKGNSEGLTCPIFRIHGSEDSIIPVRKKAIYDRLVAGSTHKMVINSPQVICEWLDELVERKAVTKG